MNSIPRAFLIGWDVGTGIAGIAATREDTHLVALHAWLTLATNSRFIASFAP